MTQMSGNGCQRLGRVSTQLGAVAVHGSTDQQDNAGAGQQVQVVHMRF
jgi:hypothetical protein